jgi:hypothetical protein
MLAGVPRQVALTGHSIIKVDRFDALQYPDRGVIRSPPPQKEFPKQGWQLLSPSLGSLKENVPKLKKFFNKQYLIYIKLIIDIPG